MEEAAIRSLLIVMICSNGQRYLSNPEYLTDVYIAILCMSRKPRIKERAGAGHEVQQPPCCCMGGHCTLPKEQNTQQSPGFGRRRVRQAGHSKKKRQALRGISSSLGAPQFGQVRTECVTTSMACSVLLNAGVLSACQHSQPLHRRLQKQRYRKIPSAPICRQTIGTLKGGLY